VPYRSPPPVASSQAVGPSFAAQGIGIRDVVHALGTVRPAFRHTFWGADPQHVLALEAEAGMPLPSAYQDFAATLGGSTGLLRIKDWQTPWDFRPERVTADLTRRTPANRAAMCKANLLPIALLGPTTELGYDDDVFLLMDTQTGGLFSEDGDRDPYDSLEALVLEWGHRELDPRMAASINAVRVWAEPEIPRQRIDDLHSLAASFQRPGDERYVGGGLGIYPLYDSGVLLKLIGQTEVQIEARCAHGVDPATTAAAELVAVVQSRGWLTP